MGRLDDAAKRKVVELRKAGLSFRKIKAVLELENIKVSAQAIYLFLREFQGRPPGRVRPEETGGGISIATPQGPGHGGAPWSNAQLQSLLREASHHAGLVAASEFAKKTTAESNATRPGSGDTDVGTRPEQSSEGNKEETGIQIISVTSLAQNGQQRCPPQASVTRAVAGEGPSTITPAMRRRVTPSPATNPILAARKRILDKALSHRAKSFQQLGSLLRREHPGVPIPDLRNVAPGDRAAYDLTAEKTIMVGQPGGTNAAKRLPPQKPGLCARAPHPPPRFGVRPPNRTPAPLVSSASRVAAFPAATTRMAVAGNLGSQQPFQESEARSSLSGVNANGLQDQVQALGSEVRGLALAVKMLVEQQCRLEREQVQQTQVQRQILGALQGLASRLSPCRSLQPQKQRNKTPSPGSTSFSQDTFTYGQGASYTQCSQSQSRYTSIDGLEAIETFKLPEISTNGFEPCSNTDTLSTAQTQTYAAAYTQQQSASLHPSIPSYSQAYASTYGQSNTQTFKRLNNNKASDFSAACSEGSLQDFGISTQLAINPNQSPKGNQLNIIKVEEP